jgi:hypothetical protein
MVKGEKLGLHSPFSCKTLSGLLLMSPIQEDIDFWASKGEFGHDATFKTKDSCKAEQVSKLKRFQLRSQKKIKMNHEMRIFICLDECRERCVLSTEQRA